MRRFEMFEAFDGQRFDSADACKAHEAKHIESRLVGLTIEQVQAALAREDIELADAFEQIGGRIERARVAAGDLRRKPKKADTQMEG